MNKYFLVIVLLLAYSFSVSAQTPTKSKSLTMEDVSPAPSQVDSTDKPASKSSRSKSSKSKSSTAFADPLEDSWREKMNETEIKVLTAELRSELANRSNDSVIELNRQKQNLRDLASEGSKKNYTAERSLDVTYRERYVKLRLQMIEEEKINPSTSETQLLYADSRKLRKRKGKTLKGQNIPMLDTKAVKTHQTKMDKLEDKLDDLIEEGRREGVDPKIFED